MMMFYLDWLKVSRLCDKSRILTGAARGYRLNHQSNILFTGNSTALIKNCTVSVTKQGNQILSSPGSSSRISTSLFQAFSFIIDEPSISSPLKILRASNQYIKNLCN